jgi:hypothetical protein
MMDRSTATVPAVLEAARVRGPRGCRNGAKLRNRRVRFLGIGVLLSVGVMESGPALMIVRAEQPNQITFV